jgi:hypothetical protein
VTIKQGCGSGLDPDSESRSGSMGKKNEENMQFREISRNFFVLYFAKLFRYVNFSNTNTFREIVSLCKFLKSNT